MIKFRYSLVKDIFSKSIISFIYQE